MWFPTVKFPNFQTPEKRAKLWVFAKMQMEKQTEDPDPDQTAPVVPYKMQTTKVHTVMTLSFRTDRSGQTVSGSALFVQCLGLHCLPRPICPKT